MPKASRESSSANSELYALLDRLDQLEELLEDMDELGVSTREEAEARMRDIHARVDALEQSLPDR